MSFLFSPHIKYIHEKLFYTMTTDYSHQPLYTLLFHYNMSIFCDVFQSRRKISVSRLPCKSFQIFYVDISYYTTLCNIFHSSFKLIFMSTRQNIILWLILSKYALRFPYSVVYNHSIFALCILYKWRFLLRFSFSVTVLRIWTVSCVDKFLKSIDEMKLCDTATV